MRALTLNPIISVQPTKPSAAQTEELNSYTCTSLSKARIGMPGMANTWMKPRSSVEATPQLSDRSEEGPSPSPPELLPGGSSVTRRESESQPPRRERQRGAEGRSAVSRRENRAMPALLTDAQEKLNTRDDPPLSTGGSTASRPADHPERTVGFFSML
ncbi:unnamed protein product [Pleuronectes platessa]|uniref:Uncharacterized protein n=1 Tax=Pleuronectes platessa TaxID=8262 RepID=A0A9N7YF71_PLEPL|nr:unnamed protein product [Pleuronectes platessa]